MMDEITRKKVDKKFYGHKRLKAKYTPQIPLSTEREYIRLVNLYMKLLKDELEKELPEFKNVYRKELKETDEYRQNYRYDSATGIMMAIEKMFQRIGINLAKKIQEFDLFKKLAAVAQQGRKLSVNEWKKVVHATLGIDIRMDYYSGQMFSNLLNKWVNDNVDLISTIPQNTLGNMKEIVYKGYTEGRTTTDMVKAIQQVYGTSKAHARLIARDQCAKLNGEIQRQQQLDAGIDEYIWDDSGDERVRDCHAALSGHTFSWYNPPEMWYETKTGRVYTGRYCHPGQDYQCRCIARPVFKRETLNIPTESEVPM